MEWVGQFVSSTDELFNGGLEGYFTLNAGTGGSTPTVVTANTPTQVTFTSQIFLGQIVFFGSNLSVGSTTLPSGMPLPVLTGGAVTRIEFLYNYRLSDAINAGIDAPELSQPAFLQPSAVIVVPSISAQTLTNAIVQSYASGSAQPFQTYLSQFNANFSGTDGPNILNGFNGGDLLRGLGGNDSLRGNDGNDILDGGTGSDTLNGGNGSDLYLPGPPADGGLGDAVGDSGTNAGDIDTISYENATGAVVVDLNALDGNQSAGWAANLMAFGIERVIGSRFNDTLIGTDFPESVSDTSADILEGGDGDDLLFGLGGSDVLQGGRGLDTLVGGQNGDVATTGPGDRAKFAVHSSQVDVFLPGDGSVLVATPGGGVDQLFEMEFIETTNGVFSIGSFAPSARQLLIGDGKDNPINGDGRESLIYGRDGNDTLNGGGASDYIEGGIGNDTIDGESGADIMRGELGNDTFFVDSAADSVVELAGEGSDTVNASVTFDLLENVHVEFLQTTSAKGTAAINLYGNTLKQTITGNAGANIISDGGAGANDTLVGLGGSDTYRIYNSGTKIVEAAGGGSDTVLAAVTFDLLAGVQVEALATTNAKGTAKINLYGNELAQTITGNAGKNILSDGGAGKADTLVGLGGDDVYRVYNSGTKIVEGPGAGSDTVQAAVNYTVGAGVYVQVLETTNAAGKAALSLFSNEFGQTVNGNAGDNVLRGYGGDDTIKGGDGADKISGGLGADMLAGNAGADTYYFSYALGASNVDTIDGFSSIDLISLSSSIFTKAGPAGALAASAFWSNTTGLAHDASDRIIWETDTGRLYYDPDGTGAAARVLFAIVTGNTGPINAGDFVIA